MKFQFNILQGADKGFTLLEVMIAVAIIGIAFTAVIYTQNTSLRLLAESNRITTATLLARNKMVAFEMQGFPDIGESEGDFEEQGYPGYSWKITVSTLPFSVIEYVREVKLEILWNEGKSGRGLELFTYMTER